MHNFLYTVLFLSILIAPVNSTFCTGVGHSSPGARTFILAQRAENPRWFWQSRDEAAARRLYFQSALQGDTRAQLWLRNYVRSGGNLRALAGDLGANRHVLLETLSPLIEEGIPTVRTYFAPLIVAEGGFDALTQLSEATKDTWLVALARSGNTPAQGIIARRMAFLKIPPASPTVSARASIIASVRTSLTWDERIQWLLPHARAEKSPAGKDLIEGELKDYERFRSIIGFCLGVVYPRLPGGVAFDERQNWMTISSARLYGRGCSRIVDMLINGTLSDDWRRIISEKLSGCWQDLLILDTARHPEYIDDEELPELSDQAKMFYAQQYFKGVSRYTRAKPEEVAPWLMLGVRDEYPEAKSLAMKMLMEGKHVANLGATDHEKVVILTPALPRFSTWAEATREAFPTWVFASTDTGFDALTALSEAEKDTRLVALARSGNTPAQGIVAHRIAFDEITATVRDVLEWDERIAWLLPLARAETDPEGTRWHNYGGAKENEKARNWIGYCLGTVYPRLPFAITKKEQLEWMSVTSAYAYGRTRSLIADMIINKRLPADQEKLITQGLSEWQLENIVCCAGKHPEYICDDELPDLSTQAKKFYAQQYFESVKPYTGAKPEEVAPWLMLGVRDEYPEAKSLAMKMLMEGKHVANLGATDQEKVVILTPALPRFSTWAEATRDAFPTWVLAGADSEFAKGDRGDSSTFLLAGMLRLDRSNRRHYSPKKAVSLLERLSQKGAAADSYPHLLRAWKLNAKRGVAVPDLLIWGKRSSIKVVKESDVFSPYSGAFSRFFGDPANASADLAEGVMTLGEAYEDAGVDQYAYASTCFSVAKLQSARVAERGKIKQARLASRWGKALEERGNWDAALRQYVQSNELGDAHRIPVSLFRRAFDQRGVAWVAPRGMQETPELLKCLGERLAHYLLPLPIADRPALTREKQKWLEASQNAQSLRVLGDDHRERGEWRTMVGYYERIVADNPDVALILAETFREGLSARDYRCSYIRSRYCRPESVAANLRKSHAYYLQAGEAALVNVYPILGKNYVDGTGIARNLTHAIGWFSKAQTAGLDVHFDLAQLYWQTGSKDEAVAHYGHVAQGHTGYSLSVFRLGLDAEEKKDFVTARAMYTKGREKIHKESIFRLGVLHQEGRGGAADPDEAIKLYEMLVPKGHSEAIRRMGALCFRLYSKTHDQTYLDKSSKVGYVAAHRVIADSLAGGEGSDSAAFSWYNKAAKGNAHFAQGDAIAMFRLGEIFKDGTFGQSPDHPKAYEYFKSAADQGLQEAAVVIAEQLHAGWADAGVGVDLQQAKSYYVRANMQDGVDQINRTLVAGAIEKLSALEKRYYHKIDPGAFVDTKENRANVIKGVYAHYRLQQFECIEDDGSLTPCVRLDHLLNDPRQEVWSLAKPDPITPGQWRTIERGFMDKVTSLGSGIDSDLTADECGQAVGCFTRSLATKDAATADGKAIIKRRMRGICQGLTSLADADAVKVIKVMADGNLACTDRVATVVDDVELLIPQLLNPDENSLLSIGINRFKRAVITEFCSTGGATREAIEDYLYHFLLLNESVGLGSQTTDMKFTGCVHKKQAFPVALEMVVESLTPERLATSLGAWDVWQKHVYAADGDWAGRMEADAWTGAVAVAEEYVPEALRRSGYLTTDPLYDYDHVMSLS